MWIASLSLRMASRAAVEKSDQKSAVSEHLYKHPDHHIKWDNVSILANKLSDFTIRKLNEAITSKEITLASIEADGILFPSYNNLIN